MINLLTHDMIVDFIRDYSLIMGTCIIGIKFMGRKISKTSMDIIKMVLIVTVISIIYGTIKKFSNYLFATLAMIFSITVVFYKYKNAKTANPIMTAIISLGLNYIIFLGAMFCAFVIYKVLNIKNEYINLLIIISWYISLTFIILRTPRIKRGLAFIKEKVENEYFNLMILNISVIIIFLIMIVSNYNAKISREFGTTLIIFSIIMCITIQKSLQLYYKHKMLIKTLEQTKEELERTKSDVKKLEEENLNFSKISHTIAHKQKALQHKLEMLSKSKDNIETEKIKKQINDVTKELKQSLNVELTKTGIEEIDNMLDYMQSECIKNNIEFQLQVSGNIYHMINNYISKDDLETILADHIKDAIIAIKHTETTNRKILVRLGKINGVYAVYFCDTGVEFEINTLMELGKKPATTYKDEGGTGMGFMNTFDTLEKTRASLIIEEMSRPKENNFTKIIKVVFDNKKEYKIVSYRYQEIEKQKTRNNLIIEKL